jgi:vitamin B12 transporter
MFWGQAIIKGNNQELALDGKIAYANDSFLLAGIVNQKSEDEINKKELKSTGYYLTNSNIFDRFIVTESLRYDNYTLFDNKTTGKIGAKYLIKSDISVSANYGTAYKVPSLYQLYTVYYGNPNLKPETTKSADITLNYKHLKATYFENKVEDLIGFHPTTYVNEQVSGTSKFKGYELSYQNEVITNLLFNLKYNQLTAKDKDGKDLQRRIQEGLKLGVDYYGFEKIHLGLVGNYIGERYDDLAKTKQTGKYTLVNTVVNYDVSKNLKTYLKIDNLTDKLYQEVDGYGTMGRTLTVGINATF